MSGLKVTRRRGGAVTNLATAITAIRDLEGFIDNLVNLLSTPQDNPSVGAFVLCREIDGTLGLYGLQAGAGASVNIDVVAKTITITAP